VGAALFGQSYRDNQAALAARQQAPDLLPAEEETTTDLEFNGLGI